MDRGLLTAGFSEGEDLIPAPAGCDPVSRFAYEMPPRVLRLGEGHYLADLGQEIVGTVALDVPGSAAWRADALHGAEVRLYMGEQLCPEPVTDGTLVKWNMNTGNRYRLAWRLTPGRRFTTTDLMTFRFVELIGLPFELTPAMLRGVTVRRASCGEGSHMDCDSPLLCDLWRLTRNTVELTTQDLYVDSQSRERGAYEGDALINQLAAYSFESDCATARFSLEYLDAPSHMAPPSIFSGSQKLRTKTTWRPETTARLCAGIRSCAARPFPRLRTPTRDFCIPAMPGEQGRTRYWSIGQPSERDGYDMSVRYNTVLNCAAVAGYEVLARIAAVVGETGDSGEFAARAAALREAILTRLYDPATGDFSDGLYQDGSRSAHISQHTAAYALYAGVYRDSAMADRIAGRLWERSLRPDAGGSRIRMSVYGTYFLLMGLYRTGHGSMANSLLLDGEQQTGTAHIFLYAPPLCRGFPVSLRRTAHRRDADNRGLEYGQQAQHDFLTPVGSGGSGRHRARRFRRDAHLARF